MKVRGFIAAAAVAVASLAFANSASATTFCVPTFSASCPDNGTNVVEADLEDAMNDFFTGGDGTPDVIRLTAGVHTDPNSIATSGVGTDPLTVMGEGRDQTFLTSASTGNDYVLNTFSGGREITFKDLAIVIPASMPDGQGSGVQSRGGHFESVDLITRNPGSNGFTNVTFGGTFKDVRMFGENGATFGTAFMSYTGGAGQVEIDGLSINDATAGIDWPWAEMPISAKDLHFKETDRPISASGGAKLEAENVLIESGIGISVQALNNNSPVSTMVTLNHATIIAQGDPTKAPVKALVNNNVNATGIAKITLFNSTVYGFTKSWELQAPTSPSLGDAILDASYSNFGPVGTSLGDAQVNNLNEVIGVPDFADSNDFHPVPGSLLVDAGDPGTTMLPEFDLDGNPRLVDGDGNGTAIRDIGAFEFQGNCETNPDLCPPPTCETDPNLCPPPTCETDPSICPPPLDTTAPKVTKVKFRVKFPKGGNLTFRLSEAAKVKAVIKPTPAGKGKKKRKTIRVTRNAKAGAVKIKLAKRRLKPGRYLITITATDAAGNKSKPIKKRVAVKPIRKR